MKIQHPDFPDLVRNIADASSERWIAAGWIAPESVEPEVIDACPTCKAEGDEPCVTAQGSETKRHFARTS